MTLHSGWDSFSPEPGAVETMKCRVCGEELAVHRNVNGPTSWAESMAGRKHPHDHFFCTHSEEDWHRQALAIKRKQEEEPSAAIKEILEAELTQIIVERKTTEGWKPSWRDL